MSENVQVYGADCRRCGSTAKQCFDKLNLSSARCCSACNAHVPASPAPAGRESEITDMGADA